MKIVLALILGFGFGFILQKVGAATPRKIVDMLRLKDLHLMKAILLGIGSSSLALFLLLALGLIDPGHLSVKSSYVGVIVGGLILGLGWAIAGFCPGTGLVGLGAGRRDALFFVAGGLLGAWLYILRHGQLQTTFLFQELGGKATLATTGNPKFTTLLPGLPPLLIAGGIAVVFIIIAWKLPDKT
jgi:uncharacterized membrane protein YedE/YeeE